MDFFGHQARARRASAWLLLAFCVAAVAVVAAINLVVAQAMGWYATPSRSLADWFDAGHWAWLSLVLLLTIGFGSWRRLAAIWGHGDALAMRLGGNNTAARPPDPELRRLLNVVEEMAIASGLPVPSVWVLSEERNINAFVAGTGVDDVALVVTDGAVRQLDRDQLQGVVAHEFSHVFHGDMRLNLQMVGILAGLENLSLAGRRLLYASEHVSGRAAIAVGGAGLMLMAIGSLGWLAGRLIRAAFSRQREFLADAAAVQYTRNPAGIVGALAAIRDAAGAGRVGNPRIEEISHLCIVPPLDSTSNRWLATHPSLDQRIQRLDPHFDSRRRGREAHRRLAAESRARRAGPGVAPVLDSLFGTGAEQTLALASGLVMAEQWLRRVPDNLLTAARSVEQAPELVCMLLLDPDAEIRRRQLDGLAESGGEAERERVRMLYQVVGEDLPGWRLSLLELAVPQLRCLPADRLSRLRDRITEISAADGRQSVFELLLSTLVDRLLVPPAPPAPSLHRYLAVAEDLNRLLWMLIRLRPAERESDAALLRALMVGFLRDPPAPPDQDRIEIASLQRILNRLNRLVPLLKPPVLQACRDAVVRDRLLEPAEAEILRLVAALLGAPAGPQVAAAAPEPTRGA